MAIDTTNEKLAIMELEDVFEPGLPISPGTLGQDDQQQLLWGFPGVLWAAAAGGIVLPIFGGDGHHSVIFGGVIVRCI